MTYRIWKHKNISLSLVKSVGFIMKGKIDLVQCKMHEYQYLYVLYKLS